MEGWINLNHKSPTYMAKQIELQTEDGRVIHVRLSCLPEKGEMVLAKDGNAYVISSEPRAYPSYPYVIFKVKKWEAVTVNSSNS